MCLLIFFFFFKKALKLTTFPVLILNRTCTEKFMFLRFCYLCLYKCSCIIAKLCALFPGLYFMYSCVVYIMVLYDVFAACSACAHSGARIESGMMHLPLAVVSRNALALVSKIFSRRML